MAEEDLLWGSSAGEWSETFEDDPSTNVLFDLTFYFRHRSSHLPLYWVPPWTHLSISFCSIGRMTAQNGIPTALEMKQAMEKMYAQLQLYESRDQQRAQEAASLQGQVFSQPTPEGIRQFFATKTEKKEKQMKTEPGTVPLPVGNSQHMTVSELSARLQIEKMKQESAGNDGGGLGPSSEQERSQSSGSGTVTLTQDQLNALLNAAKEGGDSKKQRGVKAKYPAEPSRGGNLWYLLLDSMTRSGEPGSARICHGWRCAERAFAPGKGWEYGKRELGWLVRGFKTHDEAHAAWHEIYGDKRWTVITEN